MLGEIEYRKDNVDCYGKNFDGSNSLSLDKNLKLNHENKSAYLVNKSTNKAFEFTVKVIQTLDDTISSHRTFKVMLAPGEEKWLGCTKYFGDVNFANAIVDTTIPKVVNKVFIQYFCKGQRKLENTMDLDDK
ncbi:MAG: hypothetical protein A2546_05600 [Sphingobacteriia bacterium RIFOXYD2_FULL_35_12]|nr:MAG: hypothetical protein A2472_13570 [Sphingobacteriia bacterium RIFOXYC2_FULL_35_18]OHC87836.1 MAG: hypothetical protein A2546_05600 [Sphingobacteriia bacterium RIFOXYD2_FULL_35_12]